MKITIEQGCTWLLLVILFSLLGGCGGSGSSTPSVPIVTTEQTAQTSNVTPPSLINSSPSVDDTDVAVNASVQMGFNQSIDENYISAELVNVELNTLVSGDLTVQGQVVQFTPAAELLYDTQYSFTLDYQQPGQEKLTFSIFYTTRVKKLSVTIVDVSPVNNQASFAVDSPITFQFDQNIASRLNEFEFRLSSSGQPINGELAAEGDRLIFKPTTSLPFASEFNLTLAKIESSTLEFDAYSVNFTTQNASTPEAFNSFYPEVKQYGKTGVTLHPTNGVLAGESTLVSFGVPFPRDYITDIKHFRLLDEQGLEVPIATKTLLHWHSNGESSSIRSILVQANIEFAANEYQSARPASLTLEWGISRQADDLTIVPYNETIVLVDDDEFSASDNVFEPRAYAVFEPSWYGDSVIKTRLLPKGSHPELSMFDVAFELFGDTAINYVDPRVTDANLQPYKTSYASWLFDRAMTLYQLAFRTADIKYIRSAHRASQYYRSYINERGYFALKPQNDMKYSYGESLLANYILVGDERNIEAIESMVPAWDSFNAAYTLTTNFWTERHAAFKLAGYVTAYEATGKTEYKDKASQTFTTYYQMQNTPSDGIEKTGALMHTSGAHGEGGNNMIASPWMSALLVDAVERYYLHTSDNRVPNFITQMADYFVQDDISLYEWKGWSGNESYVVPHYLAGEGLTWQEHGGGGDLDLEHTPDVTKIFSLGYYFACQAGNCNRSYLDAISLLNKSTASYTFPHWMRTSAPSSGLASYRLSPPRKFNWWFKNIANNDFLIGTETTISALSTEKPLVSISQSFNKNSNFEPGDNMTLTVVIDNDSGQSLKNVVVSVPIIKYSPGSLLSINSISNSGFNRDGTIVWKVGDISADATTTTLNVNFTINDFPATPTISRPIGNIVSYAKVAFCAANDNEAVCRPWGNSWDLGNQTFTSESPWKMIRPIAPDSPPLISFVTPINNETVSGNSDIIVDVEDIDGVDKVELLVNDELVASFNEPPYLHNYAFDTLSNKSHTIRVKAWDIYGSNASRAISITPSNPDVTAPLVAIESPQNNQALCQIDLRYSVTDYASFQCEINIDGHTIAQPSCQNLLIDKPIPLYGAKGYLNFDELSPVVTSAYNDNLLGTLTNVQQVTGKNDSAFYFNGVDAEVTFSTSKLDVSNDISVSFWLKPSSDEGVIMSQGWYYISTEYGWAISLGQNNHRNNNPMSITWSSGDFVHNANDKNVVQTDANVVVLNQWQHVLVRKTDALIDIFINGENVKSKTISYSAINWPYTSKREFTVAKAMKHPDMYQKNYHGSIDDIAIFNRALTDSEVNQLSQTGASASGNYTIEVSATDLAGNRGSDSVQVSAASCDN